MLFDTHVHFDGLGDAGAVMARAAEAGVTGMIAVGGSPDGNAIAVEIAEKNGSMCYAAVGYDRSCTAIDVPLNSLDTLLDGRTPVVAVGEIGLDFHYEPESRNQQKSLFELMLERARARSLPIIVHSRESDDDTLAVLTEHVRMWKGAPDRIGVLHCFTGSERFARQLLNLGFCISFSGILTFRNANGIREVAKIIPDDRLLIETDSPYLAPVPLRGKENEPAFIGHVAEALAVARGCTFEEIAELTTSNAKQLFGLTPEALAKTSCGCEGPQPSAK